MNPNELWVFVNTSLRDNTVLHNANFGIINEFVTRFCQTHTAVLVESSTNVQHRGTQAISINNLALHVRQRSGKIFCLFF